MRTARGAIGPLLLAVQLAAVQLALGSAWSGAQAVPRGSAVAGPTTAFAIELDADTVAARLGQRFTFTSTIRNQTQRPSTEAIAHLNVLSLDPDVYVDPEDWSAERTRYLGSVPAGSSTPVVWSVQAVNTGRLLLYVTVTEPGGTDAVSVSPTLRLTVAPQDRLTGAGALPLALGMPGALLVLAGWVAWRHRARSRPHPVSVDP
jgi:hypothetical protein